MLGAAMRAVPAEPRRFSVTLCNMSLVSPVNAGARAVRSSLAADRPNLRVVR